MCYCIMQHMERDLSLSFFQRLRIVLLALLSIGIPRRPDYKCSQFVKHMYRLARIPRKEKILPFLSRKLEELRFGDCIFLRERIRTPKKWTHVGIMLPFGYMIHMSYYWGECVTITPLSEIFKRYDLAFYLIFSRKQWGFW